ncbi:MAG: hypothetical protein AB7U18_01110 [Dehalococcoidia bacterium]
MVLAVQSRPHTMWAAIRGLGGTVLAKGPLTIVIDEVGLFINHRTQEPTGVDAWIRLFKDGSELPVDPHRIFINPPLIHDRIYDPRTAFETILWQSVIGTPNPRGWRTRGTVTTVYAGTADDGVVNRSGTTYAGCRNGTSGTKLVESSADWNDDNLVIEVGQQNTAGNDFYIWEGFIGFDTSGLPDTDEVSAAALGLVENTDYGTNFSDSDTLEARTYDWSTSVTTADWRTGTQYAALTLLASLASSSWSSSGYNTLAENGTNFQSAINKTGTTRIILGTADLAAATSPANNTAALWSIMSADNTGTTNDPKLTVTHAAAGITATPGVASLTLTAYAPSVVQGTTLTPGVASLSLTAYAPAVSTPQTVTPGVLAMTLTPYAPAVTVGINVTPGVASLAITPYAPTIVNPQSATPDTASLSLAGYAPSVVIGVNVTPDTAALLLSAFAPTVLTPVTVTPGVLSLTLTSYAPSILLPVLVTPDAASLSLTSYAPTLGLGIVPGTAALALTPYAPAVATPRLVTPDVLALILTAFAPDVVAKLDALAEPATLVLTLLTFAPDVLTPELVNVTLGRMFRISSATVKGQMKPLNTGSLQQRNLNHGTLRFRNPGGR